MTFKKLKVNISQKNNTPPIGQGFRYVISHIYFCNMFSMSFYIKRSSFLNKGFASLVHASWA